MILAAYGGPRKIDDIPGFLQAIFGSPPPEPIINRTIQRYRKIGGRSPLCEDVENLVYQLRKQTSVPLDSGFRFIAPFIDDVVVEHAARGFHRIDVFPLTPFYSAWSVDAVIDRLVSSLRQAGHQVELFTLHGFSRHEEFIDAWAETVSPLIAGVDIVFFTAHSLPLTDSSASDLYPAQVNAAAFELAERLGIDNWSVVFQSAGARGGEWLKPCIDSEIEKLEPGTRLLVVPVGFVSENVETLYDLDVQARSAAESVGVDFMRAPTPFNHSRFRELIKKIIENSDLWERCLI